MSEHLADLFGADPNYTLGLDPTRYLTHTRGECPPDVPCALCRAEKAEAECERLAWERTGAFNERDEVRAVNQRVAVILGRLWAIDPADHATKSRDYGRGFAEAIRLVRAALLGEAP